MVDPEKKIRLSKNNYLNPEESRGCNRVQKKFARLGAEYRTENGREQLVWPEQEQDFKVWRNALWLIGATLKQSDEEFREKTIPQLKKIMLESPMFSRLQYVGASGSHDTVDHIILGLSLLDTSGLPPASVFAARWAHLKHDIGKVFLINPKNYEQQTVAPITKVDYPQFHSLMGAEMEGAFYSENQDLFKTIFEYAELDSSDNALDKFHHTVYETTRLHHLGEQLSMQDRFTIEEFLASELGNPFGAKEIISNLLPVLVAVTRADSLSVKGYEHFSWENVFWVMSIFATQLEKMIDIAVQAYDEIMTILDSMHQKLWAHWIDLVSRTEQHHNHKFDTPEKRKLYIDQLTELISRLAKLIAKFANTPLPVLSRGGREQPVFRYPSQNHVNSTQAAAD